MPGIWSYSNTGFIALGQIVAKLGGFGRYDAFMIDWLNALDLPRIQVALAFREQRLKDEVFYHPGVPGVGSSIMDPARPLVPRAYGIFNPVARAAHGGWLFAAVDYARLIGLLDHPTTPLLKTATKTTFLTAGQTGFAANAAGGASVRPGIGWDLFVPSAANQAPLMNDAVIKNGRLPGTVALVTRPLSDSVTMVVLANGELIQGVTVPRSFGDVDARNLFALLPTQLPSVDIFSAVEPAWT